MAILIITDTLDYAVDEVIDWILSYNKIVYRYTFEDFIKKAKVSFDLSRNMKSNMYINGNKIEAGWLRKEREDTKRFRILEKEFGSHDGYELYKFFRIESTVAKQIFLNSKHLRWLCDYNQAYVNKIEVLEKAEECGLVIPKSFVTNNKESLLSLISKNEIKRFISKSIGENFSIFYNKEINIFQPVKSFTTNEIKKFPEHFLPTLFQEEIIKKIDLRILFLNEKVYTMAIESDNTDCRMHNDMTRYYPFKLQDSLINKLIKLMGKLDLNYGSIDLALDYDNNYYFFEVTPTGEYSNLIEYCNYNIEEEIAKYLCYGDE